MNRNLILFSILMCFLIITYAINNWISIINAPPMAKDVYMHNVENKIKRLKSAHTTANDQNIFAKMMKNNKGGLIKAVTENHPTFWKSNDADEINEGFNVKFDRLFSRIVSDNEIILLERKIDLITKNNKYSTGEKTAKKEQEYLLHFRCTYEDLVVILYNLEKNDRMYNIKTLSIKNLLQQDKPGVSVDMKISEINLVD